MQKSCTAPPSTTPTRIHSVPGQIAELRRQRRPDQRPGPGDRREVVPEDHPAVGRHEVAPVVDALRRRRPAGVEREQLGREERPVESVRDRVHGDRRDDEPDRVDRLAARRARASRSRTAPASATASQPTALQKPLARREAGAPDGSALNVGAGPVYASWYLDCALQAVHSGIKAAQPLSARR